MTRGTVKFQVDQVGYPPINITVLADMKLVILRQGDAKIHLRTNYIKEFEQAIQSVRSWSSLQ